MTAGQDPPGRTGEKMSIRILLVAILVGTTVSAFGQQPPPLPPIEQLYKMPAVYSVPSMDKVQIKRDIIYKSVDTEKGKTDLKFDLYLPADAQPSKSFPAVILISGGGIEGAPYDWRDAGVYNSYGRILAASGFVAIAFTKRYAPGPGGAERGIADTRDLAAYLREHAFDLHIDKDRFAYWAFSGGGGVLASILAESARATRAVLCFYCVAEANTSGMTPEDAEKRRRAVSSVYQVQQGGHPFPPLFIARAGLDNPALNAGIDSLVSAALAKNLSVEVMNHATGRHGFDLVDDNARSKEIIRRAVEFLNASLFSSRP
jgi:acetyl esterase/lipase